MTEFANNQRIEESFHTFNDKYIALLTDINKGLKSIGNLHTEHISTLENIINALNNKNYSKAREHLINADFSRLLETPFENNLKLNTDLNSLRIRMTNLNLLEADTAHHL